jgi:hypothetical protein
MPKDESKAVTGEVETGRLAGPFVNPQQVLDALQYAVERDPGTERKLMLFYFEDGEQIELIEVHSEARICSMTFRRRGAN